jgi:hypothetical protein
MRATSFDEPSAEIACLLVRAGGRTAKWNKVRGSWFLMPHVFFLWLMKPDGSIRDLIMSEFSKGVVLEAEQLYRGKRKYFRFDLRSAGILSPPRAAAFATVLLGVGDAEQRPFFRSPHKAQVSIIRPRFRKHREKCKRGNELIGSAIKRKFFSCPSRCQKEYSDTW